MRILWTLLKVALGLLIAIPVAIVTLTVGLGILGGLLGLAVLAIKLLCVGFIGYGLFRVGRYLIMPAPKPSAERLASPDRYYQDAMRELDAHIGPSSSR